MNFLTYLENNPQICIPMNILKLIFIDPITLEAYKCICTDREGFSKFHQFKLLTLKELANLLLSNVSENSKELIEYRKIVYLHKILGNIKEQLQ